MFNWRLVLLLRPTIGRGGGVYPAKFNRFAFDAPSKASHEKQVVRFRHRHSIGHARVLSFFSKFRVGISRSPDAKQPAQHDPVQENDNDDLLGW
jgi:hypothetical protein